MLDLSVITAIVARERVAEQFTGRLAGPRNPVRRGPLQAVIDRR